MNDIDFKKFSADIIKRCVDYMENTIPYNISVKESSGFLKGVIWTIKKLDKLDMIRRNIEKQAIPNEGTDPYYRCPTCGEFELEGENYCPVCGQKLKY